MKKEKKEKEEDFTYIPLDELTKKYGNPYKIVLEARKRVQEKIGGGGVDNKVIIEVLKELLEKDENSTRNNR